MRRRVIAGLRLTLFVGLLAVLAGCEETPAAEGGRAGGLAKKGKGKAAAAPSAEATAGETRREVATYRDEDFVDSLTNRDPFRTYTASTKIEAIEDVQRRVYMPTTAVEEMRLIAIVTGIPKPKAMLVDPLGVGHVVERGDYVGRPKVIQASGNVAMTLNWRVDRIRENEVVLTQEDATDPTRVALTKIIPLADPAQK